MTVTYTADVATSKYFTFLRLFFRWRGSVWKLLLKDMIVYMIAYYSLSLCYRFAMSDSQQLIFEHLCIYCEPFLNLIPITFILGFFISIIFGRWWNMIQLAPWSDRMAIVLSANLQGLDDRGRLMRRTIVRYICLSAVIVFADISPAVKKRFPDMDHFIKAGLIVPDEVDIYNDIATPYNKYFIPLIWCNSLIRRARREGRIRDDVGLRSIYDELLMHRTNLANLLVFDWIPIPLVYTQVVTLSVYVFMFASVFGRQFLNPEKRYPGHSSDFYFPLFTTLQLIFYLGWLKVAECMINPFGFDDDDFDMNWVLDRNLQVGYLMVDGMHGDHPQLIKDQYWDEINFTMPYTEASLPFKTGPHMGSVFNLVVPQPTKTAEAAPPVLGSVREDVIFTNNNSPSHRDIEEGDDANLQSSDSPEMKRRQKFLDRFTSSHKDRGRLASSDSAGSNLKLKGDVEMSRLIPADRNIDRETSIINVHSYEDKTLFSMSDDEDNLTLPKQGGPPLYRPSRQVTRRQESHPGLARNVSLEFPCAIFASEETDVPNVQVVGDFGETNTEDQVVSEEQSTKA